jgi:uncharacterized protein
LQAIAMALKLITLWTSLAATFLMGLTPNLAAAKAPTAKTLLWQISGNGLTQPSYLFGTIHTACTNRLTLTKQQQKAIAQVQQLYLEIDMDDPSVLLASAATMRMPGNQNLRDIMTNSDYRKVKNFFEQERRVPFWTMANIRPFYLASFVDSRKQSCNTDSRENFLLRAARKHKLELKGLETPQEVNDVLNSVSLRDEAAILVNTINNRHLYDNSAERMQTIYDRQDVNGLHQFIVNDPKATEADRRLWTALLDKRNRQWIPEIRRAMAEKPTFFGVGAGHLGGDAGVISLLEAAGYTMTPVFDIKK